MKMKKYVWYQISRQAYEEGDYSCHGERDEIITDHSSFRDFIFDAHDIVCDLAHETFFTKIYRTQEDDPDENGVYQPIYYVVKESEVGGGEIDE